MHRKIRIQKQMDFSKLKKLSKVNIYVHNTVEATMNNVIQRAELTLEFEILIEL